MATLTSSPASLRGAAATRQREPVHKLLLATAILAAAGLILFLAVTGFPYYRLSLGERPLSPLHAQLRSSGTIGLRLGILGVVLFFVLFLYPLRKRWRWLGGIGVTRHWLNFHALIGITAPLVVTFHSAFKLQGLAGLAWWIMVAVALSGFVGRYVYAKLPRGVNSVQLSMAELESRIQSLTADLREQGVFKAEDLASLLDVPPADQIRKLSLPRILWVMLSRDLARPFQVGRLRRKVLVGPQLFTTLFGLLRCHDRHMEAIVVNVRRQSRLRNGMAFLDRTERVFHLWHVIHRPFSLTFVVLVFIHVGVALSVGFY